MSDKKSEQVLTPAGCAYPLVCGYLLPVSAAWVLWTWPAWRPAGIVAWLAVSILLHQLSSKKRIKQESKPVPPEYRGVVPLFVGVALLLWLSFLFLPLAFLLSPADALAASFSAVALQAGPSFAMRKIWPEKYS